MCVYVCMYVQQSGYDQNMKPEKKEKKEKQIPALPRTVCLRQSAWPPAFCRPFFFFFKKKTGIRIHTYTHTYIHIHTHT